MKRLLCCLLCACALPFTVFAHVLDQYLQVARIAIERGGTRVELRLTPGVQVADRIFALIDVDGDGQISPAEELTYARRVLQDISLAVDGRRLPFALTDIQFPSRSEMKEGIGSIRLDLAADVSLSAEGEHEISFRNDHLPELGVYLANALVPTTEAIRITGQQRDELQHGLQIDFRVTPVATRAWPRWVGAFLFGLSLALMITQRKRLRVFVRRLEGGTRSESVERT
jgi:hypothetical protein